MSKVMNSILFFILFSMIRAGCRVSRCGASDAVYCWLRSSASVVPIKDTKQTREFVSTSGKNYCTKIDSKGPGGTASDSEDCEFKKRLKEFGEDTGPRLDLAIKLQNQKRVADKVKTSYKSVKLAILGNFVITVTKFTAAAATGSSVLLSEAIHTFVSFHFHIGTAFLNLKTFSLIDTLNQGLLMVGLNQSQKPPDTIHQHGIFNVFKNNHVLTKERLCEKCIFLFSAIRIRNVCGRIYFYYVFCNPRDAYN